MGCELEPKYNEWATNRLENVVRKNKDEWIECDKKNEERRNSIR